ncbi:hypothetical protein FCULG_00000207 [Fusarium culmorum]|uniref:Uncharacterized protein n=1 Tax=Fusarium culmorum TaxID=5516 RepID=A0A2T4GR97_FUSCU|nr:hypothetical protein FCULG_00000207 [Fusarium culmorum]
MEGILDAVGGKAGEFMEDTTQRLRMTKSGLGRIHDDASKTQRMLPLSFITSFLGQNVTDITRDKNNPTSGQVWKIAGPVSAVIILIAFVVAFFIMKPEKWESLQARLGKGKPNKKIRDVEANVNLPR